MNTTDPFKDHKTKHLFLLIGENPLPNYVSTMKLLDRGGTAYLVYTNQTNSQKGILTKALKDKGFKVKLVPLEDNKSNAYKIYEIVLKCAEKITSDERIGLHYTGGTNTMAVHVYRAISELQPKRSNTVYSYLDARTLEIFIDTSQPEPFHRGVELEVSLKDLFNLHKYEFKFTPLSQPILPDAAAEFARLYQDEEIAKTWRTWSNTHRNNNYGELKKAKYSETGEYKPEEELSNLSLNLSSIHPEIIKVLRNYLDASQEQLSLKVTKNKGFTSCQQVCEWLEGIWLEHYVLTQIQAIPEDDNFKNLKIGESQMTFIMKKSQTYEGGVFEFDVAFMRNYQLFAISCTTSKDPKECKLKLFEAYIRAKQLGGDEARVALVCCCDNDPRKPQPIERYLKSQLEGAVANPKNVVFVRKDLPDLKRKIATWVRNNKGES